MRPDNTGTLKAVLGPTNTGKTHYAIERMLAHRSGMIGLPLRLLAREVYQTCCRRAGTGAVALVTGEERIVPPNARYWVATVEAMPTSLLVECVAIDEIQTAIDFDRGHVFTNRILNARGSCETLLLGAATMAPVIRKLLPDAQIIARPRLSDLTYSGSKKITRQPARSAIVAFSASEVYAIAELIRRERGGAAVVLGALSPRTRNAQVDLYQNGDVDFLVATDAIGMGLNLDVHHIAFAGDMKFDGHQSRPLTPAEFGQIAGRAGRHTRDGTFGVTAGAAPFDPELVIALEAHDFAPVRVLQWRRNTLGFASVSDLLRTLKTPPSDPSLTLVPAATDQNTLEFLIRNDAAARATSPDMVRLLWECCQIPDYRDISPAHHGEIVTRIFTDIAIHGTIGTDWIAEQVRFCDNTSGDIDTLSNRIRQIRTWTFVANHANWLSDPAHWRDNTRDIENRLSDALHERLTQRFVDRRTSVLIRHLRDRQMVSPEINDKGEVLVEGHLIGTIEGFRFTLANSSGDADAKALRSAAANVVAPALHHRAERLADAPNEDIVLATDGLLRWRGEVVGELAGGDTVLAPRTILLADESLSGAERDKVSDRLALWLRHAINTQLETIIALQSPADLDGTARGVAFQLAENLGILPRPAISNEVKSLDQDVRGKMRKLGIKFGAYHIYLPQSLKPAPRELALILWALKNGGVRQPGVTELPQIILSGRTSIEADPAFAPRLYEIAGFKLAGKRAVRIDILERLADIIRPLIALDPERTEGEVPQGAAPRNGFRVTVEMTSLLGCAGEDFTSILKSLGYRVQRKPLPVSAPETAPKAEPPPAPTDNEALAAIEGAVPVPVTATAGGKAAADMGPLPAGAKTPDPEAAGMVPDVMRAAAETRPVAGDASVPGGGAGPPQAPEEPQFDEIWFPGGHRTARSQNAGGPRTPRADRTTPSQGKRQPGQRSGGDKEGTRPRPKHGGAGARPRPEKHDKPIDPDSPFAALAVLKTKKPK